VALIKLMELDSLRKTITSLTVDFLLVPPVLCVIFAQELVSELLFRTVDLGARLFLVEGTKAPRRGASALPRDTSGVGSVSGGRHRSSSNPGGNGAGSSTLLD
jgi:hypothetical protein